jgi:ABC-type multidrug transport system permease subunit
MADTLSPAMVPVTSRQRRPSLLRLLFGQARYATRQFVRTPIAAFFTLIFPLTFLVILCAALGNVVIDQRQGLHLAQYYVPVFAVFGVAMASFALLAVHIAGDRDSGVLKRLAGTPVPKWVQLGGLIASRVWVSLIAVMVLATTGVVFYNVQIVWHRLPALLVTLLVGIFCFAALGLAVTSFVHSPSAVQGITIGILIPLSFISDIFGSGSLPGWLSAVGWAFPLRHFANAMADDFNPYLQGWGFDGDHLLVMVGWGVVGALVAVRYLSWEKRPAAHQGADGGGRTADDGRVGSAQRAGSVFSPGRPSCWALVLGQTRYGLRSLLRDRMALFFAVIFPMLLMVFFCVTNPGVSWRGVPLPQFVTGVFAAYGIAVTTYVTLSQAVSVARERGVLKRLGGTPLPLWTYLAGRIGAAFVVAAATVVLLFGVGMASFNVHLSVSRLPAIILALAVGTATFTALGLALAMVLPSSRTVSAVALGTLLPLAFISDIFLLTPSLPPVLSAIGWSFPLRHFVNAVFEAADARGTDWGRWWEHIAFMMVWVAIAALVAWRGYTSSARTPGEERRRQDSAT